MIKTALGLLLVALLLVVFSPQIKGFVASMQLRQTASAADISDGAKDQFGAVAKRVSRGYSLRAFSDVELQTLKKLRYELSDWKDAAPSRAQIDSLLGKYEAVLRRHDL